MKIDELIEQSSRALFSIELWPPRTVTSEKKLAEALELFSTVEIDFASITYGAGGSTRDNTHELVLKLDRQFNLNPVAHLVTASHSEDELRSILGRYRDNGIENLLALRGDPPIDGAGHFEVGEFTRALQLVELAKEEFSLCVGVAAHPEGHPDSMSLDDDRRHLAEKLKVADFAITQFFYRVDDYLKLIDDLEKLGVSKPVIPGVMAPTAFSTLQKMAQLSGTEIPRDIVDRLAPYEASPDDFKKAGTEVAVELCLALLDEGVPGVHIFTMNQASTTLEIFDSVKGNLNRR
ncbi:MAG: methylenetetrahydrofolate reductase [Actinomycetota bacterium]|nr:methylenetetrahydrofolate reductase [Actinomycetota bacterium]